MNFSSEFKDNIVKKASSGSSVVKLSEEAGVSKCSIYQWIKASQKGFVPKTGPATLDLSEKQTLLLESRSIADNNMGEWLRKNGLCSDHLIKWKKEIDNTMLKNNDDKIEFKRIKKENEELRKDLYRKNQALAEVTALLALKKKFIHLWEDEEK